jgi:hypothetical protein
VLVLGVDAEATAWLNFDGGGELSGG